MIRSFLVSSSPFLKNLGTKLPVSGQRSSLNYLNGCENISRTSVVSCLQKRQSSQFRSNNNSPTVLVDHLYGHNGHTPTCAKNLPTSCISHRCQTQANMPFQWRSFHEDKKTTALTVLGSLKEIKASPVPALVLGFSGLIPFVAAPTYLVMNQLFLPDVAFAQMVYGATILSFLGGVRWGLTIPDDSILQPNWFNLTYSVTPSLVAWAGILMPSPFSSLTLMLGLAGACYMDMVSYGYPPWFKGLRFTLTFVAILSLWTTLMCSLLLDPEVKKQEKKE